MVLQHVTGDALTLKSGATVAQIKHDGSIRVGDRSIEGPGEYDIAGMGIHARAGHAVLFAEGIRTNIVWQSEGSLQDDETAASDIFVLLFDDEKAATALIKEQDPRIVVLRHDVLAQRLAQQDALAVDTVATYKITQQTLPVADREVILLA